MERANLQTYYISANVSALIALINEIEVPPCHTMHEGQTNLRPRHVTHEKTGTQARKPRCKLSASRQSIQCQRTGDVVRGTHTI